MCLWHVFSDGPQGRGYKRFEIAAEAFGFKLRLAQIFQCYFYS